MDHYCFSKNGLDSQAEGVLFSCIHFVTRLSAHASNLISFAYSLFSFFCASCFMWFRAFMNYEIFLRRELQLASYAYRNPRSLCENHLPDFFKLHATTLDFQITLAFIFRFFFASLESLQLLSKILMCRLMKSQIICVVLVGDIAN